MQGQGIFSPWKDGLLYKEQAKFSFSSYQDEVEQSYLYSFPSLFCVDVSFTDGRPFYSLDLTTRKNQIVHLCGADRYTGCFKLVNLETFYIKWLIEGPRKKTFLLSKFPKLN